MRAGNKVGMVGTKSTQTGMHLVRYYPYYSCLYTFCPYHPYFIYFFNYLVAFYTCYINEAIDEICMTLDTCNPT